MIHTSVGILGQEELGDVIQQALGVKEARTDWTQDMMYIRYQIKRKMRYQMK
jgi:hypothetical protein